MKSINKNISGWSKTVSSGATISYPENYQEVCQIIRKAKDDNHSISIRGAGRSYGDNTLNHGEVILCTEKMNKIIGFSEKNGEIIVQAGVTIEDVYLFSIKFGWLMPVVPGTRYVTIGGALGNNIHGKNCEFEGNIGEHVSSFKIILSSEEVFECSRDQNSDIFYTAISGLGLIGVIIEVTLQLKQVPSNYIEGEFRRARSIDHLIDLYEESLEFSDYSIATIDAMAKGKFMGRGVLHFGKFANNGDYLVKNHKVNEARTFKFIPRGLLVKFANTILGSKFIEIYFRFHSIGFTMLFPFKKRIFSFSEYHFLMDNVLPDYNLFHKNGFYEYQALIPKEYSKKGILELIKITQKYGYHSTMTSLKAYREQKEGFVKSFQLDGYGITMDIKKNKNEVVRQREMFLEMNDIILGYKGIQHLAKTPVIEEKQFSKMYPDYKNLLESKSKYDQVGLFDNDMCRRIFRKGDYKNDESLQLKF